MGGSGAQPPGLCPGIRQRLRSSRRGRSRYRSALRDFCEHRAALKRGFPHNAARAAPPSALSFPQPRRHLNSWQPLRPLVSAATCAPGGYGWGSRSGRRSPHRTYSINKGVGRGTRRCRGSPYTPATCSRRPPVTDAPCPSPTWHRPGKFTARRPAVPSLRLTSSRRASPVSMGTRGAGGGSSPCRGPARRHVRGRDGARRRRAVAVAERSERGLRGGERPRAGPGSLLYPREGPGPRRL